MNEYEMFNLTPSLLKCQLREFASERGWPIAATIRYFIESGLSNETTRAELAPSEPGLVIGQPLGLAQPAPLPFG